MSSGAADIFANTGGVMEAALRTAYEIVTGRPLPFENLHVAPIAGLNGVKEASLQIPGAVPEWMFLEGVTAERRGGARAVNARKVIEHIKSGEGGYHFIEVMPVRAAASAAAGSPVHDRRRAQGADQGDLWGRRGQEDPHVPREPGGQADLQEFLGAPLGEKSHHLLHTEYTARTKV